MNPVALYDALNCASYAVLHAEAGDQKHAEITLLEAQVAASGAFPIGSPEAAALGVILAAVARVPEATS